MASLYRLYRPQSFADVVGQDAVVTTLEQAAKQDKLAHAFLFAGSRGTGKTSVARILAKILMTKDIADETLQKQIIKGVEDGNVVDLLEIDAASNRGIDDVRDLIEKIQFSPVVACAKVYIIDEVHMLTKEAFNALLKTLEEPPAYAFFILATTEFTKIPSTIQSRCQCFHFRPVPEEDIVRRLQFIADQERITVEREALRLIARHVQGGMRDAISLLDQLRSLPKISVTDVEERMGKDGNEYVDPILEAIDARDAQKVIDTVRDMEENGISLEAFLHTLLRRMRQNLHMAIAEGKEIGALQYLLLSTLDTVRAMRSAPVPGLTLEAALLSFVTQSSLGTVAGTSEKEPAKKEAAKKELTKKKGEEEKTPEEHEKDDASAAQEEEETKEELRSASVEAPELSLDALRGVWQQVIGETTPASVKMSLKNGRLIGLDEKIITLAFSSAFHKDKVEHPEASRSIEQILERIFKRNLRLHCTVGDKETETMAPSGQAVDLVDAAAEIF
ncbi:DNA polymerase III, subunit gamma and tau [Candidatus Peregrinibacteria bacterium CG10_big_fil_rev_8_21_14_0_10_55_24]|nr:MAG: DNA polymerase III, subunit gamma and tau [Candidatus Peregrinibacteria bacterium CG10_big_fil_rev_8_21_14_0_10_55_24]